MYTAFGYSLVGNADDAVARTAMDEAGARLIALTPEAWWTQAMHTDQYLLQHKWSEAEAAANATLAAASSSEVDALVVYATFLMYVGRIDEAVDFFQRARAADPLSLRVSGLFQLFLDVAGRPDEAQAEFMRSKDLAGGRVRWEWAALLRSWARIDADMPTVRTQFREYLRDWHGGRTFDGVLLDLLDRPDAARDALRQAYEEPLYQLAGNMTAIFLYADLFGDENLALAALRRAFVDLDKVNFEGLWWPFVTNLRADPRFKTIVRDIGLVEYWRASGNWGDFARPLGGEDFEVYR